MGLTKAFMMVVCRSSVPVLEYTTPVRSGAPPTLIR